MSHLSNSSYQFWYDEKRVALGRSIDGVIAQLKALQEANAARPLHYPRSRLVGKPVVTEVDDDDDHDNNDNGRRADDHGDETQGDAAADQDDDLLVLRLDVRLGGSHTSDSLEMLGREAIGSVLGERFATSVRQLHALRERIDDPLSKILVTGDVNAGKSTFCNALLRRRVLPENQQPCTAIFCEVLNASKNGGREEVQGTTLSRRRDDFALRDLEQVVTDPQYTQCRVFVDDGRAADESLLSNKEVVDITVIDAPGLNHDTAHTTAVFARQEEIDVVVFVVSAANHFTISAKDFIRAATAEKEYLFIVVNAFDTIRDKERCKKGIMDQIQLLSPQTYREAPELVHFVSSNSVLAPPDPGDDDHWPAPPAPAAPEVIEGRVREFERLERSLRKFVLENRAKSKLAPARTYLLNILHDIRSLAAANAREARAELDAATDAVGRLVPQLDARRRTLADAANQIDATIEDTCRDVFDHCRASIGGAITFAGDLDVETHFGVRYAGPWSAFQYADDLRDAMLTRISDVVAGCEDTARLRATKGVNSIIQLGILHTTTPGPNGEPASGNPFERLHFRPEVMFSRKRDALARQVDIAVELQDFVDWPALVSTEKFAGAGMALTLATTALSSRFADPRSWFDSFMAVTRVVDAGSLNRVIVPGVVLAVLAAVGTHILQQIPHAVSHHLAAKVAAELDSADYVLANSTRIADRVRRVLRTPADTVRSALDRSVRDLGQRRDDMEQQRAQSGLAIRRFDSLLRANADEHHAVTSIDLEAPPPPTPGV